MKTNDLKLTKRTVGLWLVSIILCAVSLDGILGFPNLIQSSQSLPQYMVAIAHALYVMAGILVVIGIWRSLPFTSTMVIIWGIGSLVAGLGGPLVFSATQPTFLRTSIIITLVVVIFTFCLFLYTRNIIKSKQSN
jgi:hypothetical protein